MNIADIVANPESEMDLDPDHIIDILKWTYEVPKQKIQLGRNPSKEGGGVVTEGKFAGVVESGRKGKGKVTSIDDLF